MTRHHALAIITATRRELMTFIATLSPTLRAEQGSLKAWSPKDEIAHLAYWIETFVANIRARRTGGTLIDTHDYLRLNDIAWAARKDQSWAEVESSIDRILTELEDEVRTFSDEALVDAQCFTLEPDAKAPRPLIRSLLYEVVEHPLHHMVGLYRRSGDEAGLRSMLARIEAPLKARGLSRWTATARRKMKAYST